MDVFNSLRRFLSNNLNAIAKCIDTNTSLDKFSEKHCFTKKSGIVLFFEKKARKKKEIGCQVQLPFVTNLHVKNMASD